jgi:hypothetical protein
VIDPARTSGSLIFRLRQAFYAIVIAEQLKDAILKEKLVGPGLMALDGSKEQIMPGFRPKAAKRAKPNEPRRPAR